VAPGVPMSDLQGDIPILGFHQMTRVKPLARDRCVASVSPAKVERLLPEDQFEETGACGGPLSGYHCWSHQSANLCSAPSQALAERQAMFSGAESPWRSTGFQLRPNRRLSFPRTSQDTGTAGSAVAGRLRSRPAALLHLKAFRGVA
jgi:hypothetical protein